MAYGIEITELSVAETVLSGHAPDPRLEPLTLHTRWLIESVYGGDVDLAVDTANRLVRTQVEPPSWTLELVRSPYNVRGVMDRAAELKVRL